MMVQPNVCQTRVPSSGQFVNSGIGPTLVPIDIRHAEYVGLVDPDNAFWSLIRKDALAESLTDPAFLCTYREKAQAFAEEMANLRFGLGLSAVYVNPTERCNLNCSYCYIPGELRRSGSQMGTDDLLKALGKIRDYFLQKMPEGRLPQIIFHGAEPLLAKESLFAAIEAYKGHFRFGVQTNGVLLDEETAGFFIKTGTGIGLSLDGPTPHIADLTRKTWSGKGVFGQTLAAMERLKGYPGYNVICTVTTENMSKLTEMMDFFYAQEVPVIMLNMVRCTLPGARELKPVDSEVAGRFISALERTHKRYLETGRKMVVANFANILVSILAPTARRLMCDISPCGGGRVFFALAPDGGMFPCSEFIGLPEFRGGNLFVDDIEMVLETDAFRRVTGRKVEDIDPCCRCAIRHFCGSPCPAEAQAMGGDMKRTGAFCEFYEEQVRFALRLIADGRAEDFLWDEWDRDTETVFQI